MTLPKVIFFLLFFLLPTDVSARDEIAGPVLATVVKVRDGDSVDVIARVWPGHDIRVSIRLRGIDAPELNARCEMERKMAVAARDRLRELLELGTVQLTKISGGKYFGRMLAQVHTHSGVNVQRALLAEKLVRPYRGRKRKTGCLNSVELQ